MRQLFQLQKSIKNNPTLIKEYIQSHSKDEYQLNLIVQAIINVYKSQGPTNDKHSLQQCHKMAISANKNLIQRLYIKIVPQFIKVQKSNSLFFSYLKMWTVMFPGKWKYSQFPNFQSKYSKMVQNVQIPFYLKQTRDQYQNNIKINNQAIQFFQDSLSSEYSTQRNDIGTQPVNKGSKSLQQFQTVKSNIFLGNNDQDTLKWIIKLYQLRHRTLLEANNDPKLNQALAKNVQWMNQYINQYESVKDQPSWRNVMLDHYQQLQEKHNTLSSNNWNFESMKINSQRAINFPKKQQDFNQFRRVINSNSPLQSRFQASGINTQQPINSIFQNNVPKLVNQTSLVIKKHVPGLELSPIINHTRNKIFDHVGLSPYMQSGFSRTKDLQKSMNKSIKLSQFSYQKNIRKKKINQQELDHAPQWLIIPYLSFFNTQKLFARYRKNTLLQHSTILQDERIVIHCVKKRISSTALEFIIDYQNYSRTPIELNVCYKISHQAFSVKSNKKIRSSFILNENQTHNFILSIKQLPLKICSLQLVYDNNLIQVPLPFSIINFTRSELISKQQFFHLWNLANNKTNYSLSTKIFYNKNIINSQQIYDLFDNCIELGRTQNYSFQQYGLKLNFQYYNLQFLLIFAFNIDTYLTFQMVCCHQIDSERVQVLNYYMKIDPILKMILKLKYN